MKFFSILLLKFNYLRISFADFFINIALIFSNTVYLQSKSFWWVEGPKGFEVRCDQHYVALTFSFKKADRVIIKRKTPFLAIHACEKIHKLWIEKFYKGFSGSLHQSSTLLDTYTLYLDPILSTTTWGISLG